MNENLSFYSQEEFNHELGASVAVLVGDPALASCKKPQAILLGGQSGAGKTMLHQVFTGYFEENVAVINGDEYRSRHPRYRELDKRYGPEAVKHTAAWAGEMTEALIDALSIMQYNLIIEGTLRTADVPSATVTLLRSRGYGVSLALMAVKPEISLISCQIRYEQMRLEGTIPRATDPAHHNKIIEDIVDNLGVLEQSGLFDVVSLFSRAGERLYPPLGRTRDADERLSPAIDQDQDASEALREVLFGPWSAEERMHYEFLQDMLARLKGGQQDDSTL